MMAFRISIARDAKLDPQTLGALRRGSLGEEGFAYGRVVARSAVGPGGPKPVSPTTQIAARIDAGEAQEFMGRLESGHLS